MGKIEMLLGKLEKPLKEDPTIQKMIVADKSDVENGKFHIEADEKAYYLGDVIAKELPRGDGMIKLLDQIMGDMILVCYIDLNSHIEYEAYKRDGTPAFGYIFSIDNEPVKDPVLKDYRPTVK
ncbi:MAG: hypothetical protein CL582_16790 [Alteromonadaceae bacterium]|nr:hypothetical protein [Alteromonadaceae bacterium]